MSDAGEEAPVQEWPKTRVLEDILYCGVCSMPVEYCEFSGTTSDCQKWLQTTNPTEFARIWPEIGAGEDLEKLSLEKDGKKEAKEKKKKAAAKTAHKVVINRVERTRRKCVIEVTGLEHFGVDLKKAAKLFANKFATGSSVTKNPQGFDEIVVQGDVQDDIYELILKTWPEVPDDLMDLTESKKK
ncbi:density-regulated protein DRP1 [Phlyctochytrium arcticum]|nr:density-regulated protein DRP1 [Phlyctochytrium arcticum]